jgi:hypothetical protein
MLSDSLKSFVSRKNNGIQDGAFLGTLVMLGNHQCP